MPFRSVRRSPLLPAPPPRTDLREHLDCPRVRYQDHQTLKIPGLAHSQQAPTGHLSARYLLGPRLLEAQQPYVRIGQSRRNNLGVGTPPPECCDESSAMSAAHGTVTDMDTSNIINTSLLGVTGLATAASVWSAVVAHRSRKDAANASVSAGEHERAANAARAESSAALTRVADLIEQQTAAMPDWVAESQGGGHYRWDVTNRTGKRVMARLDLPDQGPSHELKTVTSPIFDTLLEPGDVLGFTWSRRGPGAGLVVRVNVIWSDYVPKPNLVMADNPQAEQKERLTPLRVKWPER